MTATLAFLAGVLLTGLVTALIAGARKRRLSARRATVDPEPTNPREVMWRNYIKTYEFPPGVIDRALARCPRGTSPADLDRGLRQFFLACGSTPDLAAAMPSKTVDEAWHEFLTYTRAYAAFCDKAFGRLLHHVPEVTMTQTELDTNHGLGMVLAWVAACHEENLPVFGRTAPTLFAADARAHAGGRGWRKLTGNHTYVGFCGTDPADAPLTDACTANPGTVCMRHAYAPAWRDLGSEVSASRWTANTPDRSRYDATMLAALVPVLVPDTSKAKASASVTTAAPSTVKGTKPKAASTADKSARATTSAPAYDPTPAFIATAYSSCGSSSSSSCGSSSSSCGSSSSSCGGGGGCGGSC